MSRRLYSAQVTVDGGRGDGHAVSSDGALDVPLRQPTELGGDGGATNPEQLLAAAQAADFADALRSVGRHRELELGDIGIESEVILHSDENGGYFLSAVLGVTLSGIDDGARAAEIVAAAHRVSPFANATRGNVTLTLTANGHAVHRAS